MVSYAAFSLSSPFSQPLTACIAARMAIGPPSQMLFASSTACSKTLPLATPAPLSSSSEICTSLSHRPIKYASSPDTRLPVRTISLARLCPIMAGSLYVPPPPGMIASLVSGSPSDAVEARTRKCVHSASSRPPPKAVLLIAEMVGICKDARRVKVLRRLLRNSRVLKVSAVSPLYQVLSLGILVFGERQALLQVSSSAEGIIAFGRQNQRSSASLPTFCVDLVYDATQLGKELSANGIACFRSVQ